MSNSLAVVITGVSSGIGYATTKLFNAKGIRVFGSVRKPADAERLVRECGSLFHPLMFDVTDQQSVREAALIVRDKLQGQTLNGLINNAGMAVIGDLLNMPIEKFEKQLNTNLIGQLIVTQAFVPLLGADQTLKGKPGKIINISSVSGKHGFPFMGAYCTSKHGVEGLSETLRRELMIYGIDVIIVGPGIVKTPIWNKVGEQTLANKPSIYSAAEKASRQYAVQAEKNGLPVEKIAELLLKILQDPHPAVRYAPVPNKLFNWTLLNLIPKRLVDWVIAKKIGLIKKA